MLRRNRRIGSSLMSIPEPQQFLVDVGEMVPTKSFVAMRDVEVDVIQPQPLDLIVDHPGNDVAGRELATLVERARKKRVPPP